MIIIKGEVRKVVDHGYKDKKTGSLVKQALIVIEPDQGRQNYEVMLTTKHVDTGIRKAWEALIGKSASVAVSLYVNYEYKFYKFTASNDAKPIV